MRILFGLWVAVNAALVAFHLSVFMDARDLAAAATADKAEPQKATFRSISLVDEDGKERVVLTATRAASGIWITDQKNPKSIFTAHTCDQYGVAFGLYSPAAEAMSLAFTPDKEKGVVVQYLDAKGKVAHKPFADLIK